jgi:hypothetical protein
VVALLVPEANIRRSSLGHRAELRAGIALEMFLSLRNENGRHEETRTPDLYRVNRSGTPTLSNLYLPA